MNRAWIPAGALASLSVAGLLALGPLTDSMGTKVAFPVSVQAPDASEQQRTTEIPVNFEVSGPSGKTETENAALTRGGASETVPPPNSDAGQVGLRISKKSSVRPTSKPTATVTPDKKKATKPKRQTSIQGLGETNSTSGLTGGSGAGTDKGEQALTPANDTP